MANLNVRIPDLIEKKKDGKEFTDVEIKCFIDKLLSGGVADSQLGAWLMATCINGLNTQETFVLTKAMTDTGSILQWPEEWKSILVDKHSTGGVGDKVSLILAPALAAVGLKVPMISGRGLGITGGTLDKLESIPGYRVSLSEKEIHNILDQVGCCIAGQTGTIAPADKKMYACRDITATVQNLSLMTSSIICKKAAENLKALVLDVKFGNGSYSSSEAEAAKLAASLISVSRKFGMKTSAVISSMNCPLGCTVGNSLEVEETIECLKGKGPADLRELVVVEGSLLMASVKEISLEDGEAAIKKVLDDGSALSKFKDMITLQGVSHETAEELCHGSIWKALKLPQTTTEVKAKKSGVVQNINARKVATVSQFLGAGRAQPSDQIDHSVGVKLKLLNGQPVEKGQTWATVYHQGEELPDHLLEIMNDAIEIVDEPTCSSNGTIPSKIVKIISDTDDTNNLFLPLS